MLWFARFGGIRLPSALFEFGFHLVGRFYGTK